MRSFKTASELLEIAQFVNGAGHLDLKIHLKFCTDIPNPDAVLEVCAHPWPNPKALMTILRQTYTRTWVAIHLINGGQLSDVDALLKQTSHLLDKLDEFWLWHTETNICTHVGNILSTKFNGSADIIHTVDFSIPPEKQKEVDELELILPEGFTFCQLNPEADHQFVTETWSKHYATRHEALNIKAKLERFPSVGVRFGDKLVAFEIMHHTGTMNHLYTVPEFRGKGLGTIVELKLVQKLIKMGITPYKFVDFAAPLAMSLATKSGYWSKTVDEETNKDIVFDFHVFNRK